MERDPEHHDSKRVTRQARGTAAVLSELEANVKALRRRFDLADTESRCASMAVQMETAIYHGALTLPREWQEALVWALAGEGAGRA